MPLAVLALWLAATPSTRVEPRPLAPQLILGTLEQEQDPKPTPEQVRAALQALEEGLASPEPAERVTAIRENAKVDVAGVVAKIAGALDDRAGDVRLEAIDALGRSKQASALEALLAHHKKHRIGLRKQERVLPRLLTAIARHGEARAIQPLTDDVQAQMLSATLRARILGLANVRTKSAVDALVDLAGKIGFVEMHNHAEDFRLAMLVLTGVDKGRSIDAWRTWWKNEREGFAVPEEPPALAPGDATRWNEFWGSRRRPDGR